MSDETERRKKLTKVIAETAITLGVPALATAVGGPPAGLAAAGAVKVLLSSLDSHVAERKQERTQRWTAGLVLTLAEAGVGFEELSDDDEFRDVVYQTVRASLDALDPNVAPFLGRLTAWYRERPLDPFFRGAVRTLRDLTGSDLVELKRIMGLAAATSQLEAAFDQDSVSLEIGPRGYLASRGISDSLRLAHEPETPDVWLRVWGLLSAHHLAQLGKISDPMVIGHTLGMQLADAERFANLLAVPAAPPTDPAA